MLGAILGGLGIAADLIGGKAANDASAREARANRQWQERLSNTAVQRRVEDLKKANLNPMLAFMGGGAGAVQASSPTGGMAHFENIGKGPGQALTSAATAMQLQKAQLPVLASQAELNTATARKNNADAAVIEGTGSARATAETDKMRTEIQQIGQNMTEGLERITKLRTENAQLEAQLGLERELKGASIRAINAGIPLKDLISQLATMGVDMLNTVQDKRAQNVGAALIKDTVNMLEDKYKNSAGAMFKGMERNRNEFFDQAKNSWESFKWAAKGNTLKR
ncbi:MAG: DNA pilot protein [Microvirus sp.]|nr:MAG: DNA pilot protein [Microvirus sp.]